MTPADGVGPDYQACWLTKSRAPVRKMPFICPSEEREGENRWGFIVAWNPHIAQVERKCSVELLDILDVGRGLGSLGYLEINRGEER